MSSSEVLSGKFGLFLDIMVVSAIGAVIGAAIGWVIRRAGGPDLLDRQWWWLVWTGGFWLALRSLAQSGVLARVAGA